jgi:hypothetical protein
VSILVEKDDEKTGLQDRITADLRERASATSKQEDVDLVEDSELLRGTKKSGQETMFWIIVAVLAILSLIVIFALK